MKDYVQEMYLLSDENFVEEMYLKISCRKVDDEGKKHHVNLLKVGMTRDEMLFHFRLSPEAVSRNVPLARIHLKTVSKGNILERDGREFIDAVYLALLGRTPEIIEVAESLHMLDQKISKETFIDYVKKTHEDELVGVQIIDETTSKRSIFRKTPNNNEERVFVYQRDKEENEYSGVLSYKLYQLGKQVEELQETVNVLQDIEFSKKKEKVFSRAKVISDTDAAEALDLIKDSFGDKKIYALDLLASDVHFCEKLKEEMDAECAVVMASDEAPERSDMTVIRSFYEIYLKAAEENSFHVVTCFTPIDDLKEVYRILKNKGLLIVKDFDKKVIEEAGFKEITELSNGLIKAVKE